MISVVKKKNTRLKLALAIPAGAPRIITKEIIDIPLLVEDKQLKYCEKIKSINVFTKLFTHYFFSWISELK